MLCSSCLYLLLAGMRGVSHHALLRPGSETGPENPPTAAKSTELLLPGTISLNLGNIPVLEYSGEGAGDWYMGREGRILPDLPLPPASQELCPHPAPTPPAASRPGSRGLWELRDPAELGCYSSHDTSAGGWAGSRQAAELKAADSRPPKEEGAWSRSQRRRSQWACSSPTASLTS